MKSLWLAVLFAASAPPALAHHSFAAEYDASKPVKITGVITRMEWTNPHAWIYLDARSPDGAITHWGFSANPPGVLMRRGLRREDMKPGTVIQVEGFRAKDGSANGYGRKVTFGDGRSFYISGDTSK
ncbi:MAG TPA: DUF6152 family protein [Bryobacteraceae bacterium]|nr:DUF6152 family protein [Bryobacteraceae bacterium]